MGSPPDTDKVAKVGFRAASRRADRYRSAEPHFNRARIAHIRRFDKSPGPAALDAIRQHARSLKRGTGPSRVKDSLQLQEIEDDIELPTAKDTRATCKKHSGQLASWSSSTMVDTDERNT